ncbi:MAG: nucleotidyltransferase [Acidobacteria bacterium]|nr:MAG: nucleotidyltransferase [Acidobacteriota bacterium]
MWGIVPAAGAGSRIQPLAFSKELLPVGSRYDGTVQRPRAVSEYLIERMIRAGADKICFVISPGKSDIMEYFGGSISGAHVCYTVQPRPIGLCDALFRALPLLSVGEVVNVGLPDTIWFPENALSALPTDTLSFLLFPVDRPELFDAVVMTSDGKVQEIQVKKKKAASNWIWGAFRMPTPVFKELYDLWCQRDRSDEYVGSLVNAYIARGGRALGVRAGQSYVDVGTLHGYHEAMKLLDAVEMSSDDRSRNVMERAQ